MEIFNFVQIEEENLSQAWGRLLQLLKALRDQPLKKNEILDIFYNGQTDASRDYLDSCVLLVACVGIFPEEEGMMQHSRDKYFPQL